MPLFGRAVPLWTRLFPKANGPRGLNYTFKLSTQTTITQVFQLTEMGLDMVNGAFIDNSLNQQGFSLINPTTGHNVFIPAFSQGRVGLLTQQSSDNVTFVGTSTGGLDVPVIFSNVEPQSDMIWSVIPPGSVTGSVVVTGQITSLPLASAGNSRNATLTAGGTSQLLIPANVSRRRMIIQNPFSATGEGGIPSAEPIFFRFGGVAGINDGSSFELYPGASYDSADGPVYNGVVNFNAATTNHKVVAWEF